MGNAYNFLMYKNRYKIRKQWEKILSEIQIPKEFPINYTRSYKILLTTGSEYETLTKKDFEKSINTIIESGSEIKDIMVELDFEKLIISVEKNYQKLINQIQ